MYTEVSSFQGVGIEEFHVYRGVFISGCRNTVYKVSSFQGVGIKEFHCIQRCPHFVRIEGSIVYRGVLISGGWNRGIPRIQRCLHFRV